jgi:hypothetical protein
MVESSKEQNQRQVVEMELRVIKEAIQTKSQAVEANQFEE